MNEIKAQIELFLVELQKLINAEYKDHPFAPPVVTVEYGTKNAKIVRSEYTDKGELITRSVHCFIDITTGDILKAASWKVPAKGVRGNIYTTPNYGVGTSVGVFGAAYRR